MKSEDPPEGRQKEKEHALSRRGFLEMGAAGLSAPVLLSTATAPQKADASTKQRQWSKEKASQWYAAHDWIVGANFIPSTAVNSIEMWQKATFDAETIDRELGWAEEIGFNTMRVYLHYLVWARHPQGYKERIDRYLEIADRHRIETMFVLFDDAWGYDPQLGPQPKPMPGIHNSGWVQCPGEEQRLDSALQPVLEAYVKDVISTYADDERVLMWDLYNEPRERKNAPISTLSLLKKITGWARDVKPRQPLTLVVWGLTEAFEELTQYSLSVSDIITFHIYSPLEDTKRMVNVLKKQERPIVCTEYMARTLGSTFEMHLPYFHEESIGAINWGLVSGKTQTIYAWQDPRGADDAYWAEWLRSVRASYPLEDHTLAPEPDVWFHDIFRRDGTPFDPEEVELIRSL